MNRALITTLAVMLPSLAACQDEPHTQLTDKEFEQMAEAAKVAPPENRDAQSVVIERQNELYEFGFSYPREAAAIAALDEMLRDQARGSEKEIEAMARKEAEIRRKQETPFHGLYSKTVFGLQGNTQRFLSLVSTVDVYTGGAHPNRGSDALLWDRVAEKPVDIAVLFGSADNRDAALRGDFCAKIEAARRDRVGDVPDDSMFADCPDLDSITIAPADSDGDGLFDRFHLIADPYVAGSWAEGDYEIDIPADAKIVTLVAQPYRDGFEQ